MRLRIATILLILPFSLQLFASSCEELGRLSLPHTTITMAMQMSSSNQQQGISIQEGSFKPFCRISATLRPSSDSDIKIEVWMPINAWNGKYQGTGNGGYAGTIDYRAMAKALTRGYAVANTDMGTAPSSALDGDALIAHPEKWTDWGWRATHEMTLVAKQIIAAYYGEPPRYSYFVGCSTGGEQALMEAQRFPEDYDGIIAGAPANNRTRLHMAILWKAVNDEPTPNENILHDKLSLITRSVLAACPKQKAVPTDAFFSLDPSECHWNPEALLCKASEKNDCLTKPQVEAVRRIYQGPMNATTQTSLYPGVPAGSEAAWTSLPESPEAPFDSLFKWVYGPAWDWRSFDFDRNAKQVDTKLSPALNATNPDLTRYETLGHKLIVYHGWADWLVAPEESIHYFNAVSNLVYGTPVGEYRHTQQTQSFYRLFMVPGMSHCGGGPGLNTIDALPALEKWVEDGVAPEQIVAVRTVKGTTELSRPVCPYPQTAHYTGLGHTNEAASFSCAN